MEEIFASYLHCKPFEGLNKRANEMLPWYKIMKASICFILNGGKVYTETFAFFLCL